jgi:hypothetical protein
VHARDARMISLKNVNSKKSRSLFSYFIELLSGAGHDVVLPACSHICFPVSENSHNDIGLSGDASSTTIYTDSTSDDVAGTLSFPPTTRQHDTNITVRATRSLARSNQPSVRATCPSVRANQFFVRANRLFVRANRIPVRTNRLFVRTNQLSVRAIRSIVRTIRIPVRANLLTVRATRMSVRANQPSSLHYIYCTRHKSGYRPGVETGHAPSLRVPGNPLGLHRPVDNASHTSMHPGRDVYSNF